MITETLHSEQFIALEQGFLQWLGVLGYSPATLEMRRRHIRPFLLYLERCRVSTVGSITSYNARRFVKYLKQKENKVYGAGLSTSTINVGIATVNKFFEYLRISGTEGFTVDKLSYQPEANRARGVLTQEEVLVLYDATHYRGHFTNKATRDLQQSINQRDRAMLSIYYGCGLRKSEGVALDLSDVHIHRGLVHVRKGKGSRERYVPISEKSREDIREYLQVGRAFLASGSSFSTEAFLLNQMGGRCGAQALSYRLKKLISRSGSISLQEKDPSLHTLRHSIATHLLQSGMEIELIQQFLGHRSLESTQIYTHLVHEL